MTKSQKQYTFNKSNIYVFGKSRKINSQNRINLKENTIYLPKKLLVRESTLQKNVTIFIKIKERLLDSNLIEDSKNYFLQVGLRFYFRKLFFQKSLKIFFEKIIFFQLALKFP